MRWLLKWPRKRSISRLEFPPKRPTIQVGKFPVQNKTSLSIGFGGRSLATRKTFIVYEFRRRLVWTERSSSNQSPRCRMSVTCHVPNVPQIETDDATDPGLRQVIERAKVTKSASGVVPHNGVTTLDSQGFLQATGICSTAAAPCLTTSRSLLASRSPDGRLRVLRATESRSPASITEGKR